MVNKPLKPAQSTTVKSKPAVINAPRKPRSDRPQKKLRRA